MGCFDLSKSLCDQIGAMIPRFWWNHQEGKHKIQWLRKEQMLKRKEEWGLAKQSWRLWQHPDSLCARVLKAKYFESCSVPEAKPKNGMSYSWRSILRGLDFVKKGMIWRVGDGVGLNIWSDPWIPRDSLRRLFTPRGSNMLSEVVELIDPYKQLGRVTGPGYILGGGCWRDLGASCPPRPRKHPSMAFWQTRDVHCQKCIQGWPTGCFERKNGEWVAWD